jgi:putative endonuclease
VPVGASVGPGARVRPAGGVPPRAAASRRALGRHGEDLAAEHLVGRGWRILDRNWFGRGGELDLVALDVADDAVVGVEVKTRRSNRFGTAAEAVTPAKVRRLRALTAQWLAAHDVHADGARVDVVTVDLRRVGGPVLEHLVGVG